MAGFYSMRKLKRDMDGSTREVHFCRVFSLSDAATTGILQLANLKFPVTLGRGGIGFLKREGDGATPRGTWRVRDVYYRSDRIRRPPTKLTAKPIRPHDSWCDAANDRNYNRKVSMPYKASAEKLWRQDGLYDLVVVLDYNEVPRVKGRGSAIFLHIARRGFSPTEGCIAMSRQHLLRLLAAVSPPTAIAIGKGSFSPQRGRRGLR